MRRMLCGFAFGLLAAAVANGHALYIVAAGGDPAKAVVVFSDDLAPDANIKEQTWQRLAGLKLSARAADGTVTPVKYEKGEHCLKVAAPAGTRVIFGQVDHGVYAKGEGKPALVRYYPKAVLGGVPADGGRTDAPFQIVPAAEAGKVRFRVLADGKPAAGVTVSVMLPEKKEKADATTDESGYTPAFDGTGRYAATARRVEEKAGEANGQKYAQVSHVATLVVDVK